MPNDFIYETNSLSEDRTVASPILARGSPVNESHRELADDLGVSRENVSRVAGDFRDHGRVRLGRRHIDIVDASASLARMS